MIRTQFTMQGGPFGFLGQHLPSSSIARGVPVLEVTHPKINQTARMSRGKMSIFMSKTGQNRNVCTFDLFSL